MKVWTGIYTVFFCSVAIFAADHNSGGAVLREANGYKPNKKYLDLCTSNGRSFEGSSVKTLDKVTDAALSLLQNKCATCHNSRSEDVPASMRYDFTSSDELVRHGLISPGKAEESTLINRIEDGSMPASTKRVKSNPLTAEEKKVLRDWISSGAKSFFPGIEGEIGRISDEDFEACMVKDLRNINESDRPFIRYVNLGNLYNSGRQNELGPTKLALNKLLNSLSWKKKITNPVVIDGTNTLLRMDLRDYRWTPEQWEEIAKLNPYPQRIANGKTRELSEKTGTNTPSVRGDWLVFSASKPPLYHTLLGLPQKVGNVGADTALEKLLLVNAAQNEASGDMTRAGFKKSNVTKSNRAIENHETPFGAYWKSHDFKTREGEQNIFEHPLDFERNGGEFIFNLPNGLQGYLVVDAEGNRLDEAPTDIVIDPLRLDKNGAVVNGISCISCHTKGMKRKDDEVLPHFLNLERLANTDPKNRVEELLTEIKAVKKLYKDNKTLNQKYEEGEKIYADAIRKTGGNVEPDKLDEPVFSAAHAFEAPLDIRSMAAELGHEPKEVEELINGNLTLQQKLALGAAHTVDRDVFNKNFRLLKGLLSGAENFGAPGIISSDPQFDRHFNFVGVKPGTFKMGSPANEDGRNSAEKQHQVTITKPFEIQTTTVTQSLWQKVMGNNPSSSSGSKDPSKPVDTVSWNDITKKGGGFLDKLNALRRSQGDRCTYRLPTEAEWEYAARGGNQVPDDQMETAYSFGNDVEKLKDFAWFADNSGGQTHIVDDSTKGTNPLGLHDMHGNVWQWCQDSYQVDTSSLSSADPFNDSFSDRVTRGGAKDSRAEFLRSAKRLQSYADGRFSNTGFRLVRTCPFPDSRIIEPGVLRR